MEQIQDIQKYNAKNVASSLGEVRNSHLLSFVHENFFVACLYITLFVMSSRILLKTYYPPMLQHAKEIYILMKHDLNNGKEEREEFMNKVTGYLRTCRVYILSHLSTILGATIKKLKSTDEGVQNVQGDATQDNLLSACHDDEDYENGDDEADEDVDFEDNEDDGEEHDENENDAMEKGSNDGSLTKLNIDMKGEGSNDSLAKVDLENAPENKPNDSFTKEGEEDMTKEKTDEKFMKDTEDANKQGTADNDVKEDIIEKKNEKDSITNEQVKHGENVTIESETKGQSKSETGEELKREKGGPSKSATGEATKRATGGAAKRATGGAAKRATGGAAKRATGGAAKRTTGGAAKRTTGGVAKSDASGVAKSDASGVAKSDASGVAKSDASAVAKSDASGEAKRDTTGVPKRETAGQEKLQTNGQTNDKTYEELMNMTQDTNAGTNNDITKKILNFKNIISKDKENGEKGVNVDESNKELTEEWKVNEWNKWMRQLEEQWHFYFITLETKTIDWMKQKEEEFNTWLTEMENKWMSYNHNLDTEYNTNLYKKYLTWDETDWKTWIKTVGKRLIEEDWVKWINDHECKLNEWFNGDWNQWKSLKNFNWEMNEWKSDEYERWAEWQNGNLTLWLNKKKKKKYLTWKNRIEREKSEWDSWVRAKDDLTLKSKTCKWIKWKNEKRLLFNDWVENFINTWISRKQWNSWVIERRNLLSRRTSSSY
ncbi:tryptophan-rich antigen [Plasmodium vivax]|uniref:Tryptophan-rich antigen n=1 Tax=Plasmodium vivax TaxID=5855 RepID=A0A565A3T1_PLAVI|nr:tryptophan-rich antigen [Plasmodium vivax]